jgi:hypothetical protein
LLSITFDSKEVNSTGRAPRHKGIDTVITGTSPQSVSK